MAYKVNIKLTFEVDAASKSEAKEAIENWLAQNIPTVLETDDGEIFIDSFEIV